jgi:hypothetical protein
MTPDAKRVADKFASAIAAVANADPTTIFEAAAYIRGPQFSADTADPIRSAVNAFAYFMEKTAADRARVYRETYGKERP